MYIGCGLHISSMSICLFMRWTLSVSLLSDLVCAADDLMRKLSADKNGAVDIILRHNRVEVSGDCDVMWCVRV